MDRPFEKSRNGSQELVGRGKERGCGVLAAPRGPALRWAPLLPPAEESSSRARALEAMDLTSARRSSRARVFRGDRD